MLSLMTLLSVGWPGLATGGSAQSADHATPGLQPSQPTSLVCGTSQPCLQQRSGPDQVLEVGAYITVLDGFDMLDNHVNVDFYLWTRWSGDGAANPSDTLTVLNAPNDNNIDAFEQLDSRREGASEWRLYKVRRRISIPWRLQNYPFDRHAVLIRIGPKNPLSSGFVMRADGAQSGIDPELILYDWTIGRLGIEESAWSLQTTLGSAGAASNQDLSVSIAPTLQLSIPLTRRSGLALLSSFLGDLLAIGLCMLSLIIPYSRDDLILGAVFAAAGNSIFLAQLLPISALSGFAGYIQLIIYVGILYVVIADELLDRVFRGPAERLLRFIRPLLLPSYVLGTLLAIYKVIPNDVLS